MGSGWIVTLKNGESYIISDVLHNEYIVPAKADGSIEIESEERCLDMQDTVDKHPWLPVYE